MAADTDHKRKFLAMVRACEEEHRKIDRKFSESCSGFLAGMMDTIFDTKVASGTKGYVKVKRLGKDESVQEWVGAQLERDYGPRPIDPEPDGSSGEEAEQAFSEWRNKTGKALQRIVSCTAKDDLAMFDPTTFHKMVIDMTSAIAEQVNNVKRRAGTRITIVEPLTVCVKVESFKIEWFVHALVYNHPRRGKKEAEQS